MANIAPKKNKSQEDFPGALDLDYIRRQIPIELVAFLLNLDVQRHFAPCFRMENHPNGDSHPSLHFLERKNCAICFRCDQRAMSNIDLVMGVLRCDFAVALKWFRKEFNNLPTLRGRPAGLVHNKPFRVGLGGELEDVIRSGIFATLTEKAVRVLVVILNLRDSTGRVRISYPELRHATGIGSQSTIRAALDELLRLHLIDQRMTSADSSGLKPKNAYVPTLNHPELLELMRTTFLKNREVVAQQIDYYREAKLNRRRTRSQTKPKTFIS
jgi:hypothetical protein